MDKTSMKPTARSFGFGKALLLVGSLAGLIIGSAACADAEGTTPDCTQDVGDGTHDRDVEKGCNPFAVCVKGGQVVKAEECCKDIKNDYEQQVCLYGYGAGPAPGTESSSSSSSSGSSSSGG
jgi:hypothetical protein